MNTRDLIDLGKASVVIRGNPGSQIEFGIAGTYIGISDED